MQISRSISGCFVKPPGNSGLLRAFFAKFTFKAAFRLVRRVGRRIREDLDFYRNGAPRRDRVLTGFVFLLGIVLATGGFFAVQHYYRTKAQQEFEGPAAQFTAVLAKAFDGYVEVVNSVAAFFASSDKVDRWQFFEFAGEILPRYPGLQALEWIPRVPGEQRKARERRAQADGLFGFRFNERDSRGTVMRAPWRQEHFPAFYVEPFEGNEALLGRDLAGDPSELEVLTLARDIGAMVATRARVPAAGGANQPVITVVTPIYRSDAVPETVRARRDNLLGFARGTFRLGDLMTAALPKLTAPPGLDIYLYDRDAGPAGRLIYYHPSPLRQDRPAPLSEQEAATGLFSAAGYDLAGWRWSIVVKPVTSHFTYNVTTAAWSVWAVTLLLTALLMQYLVSSQTRTQSIERSVKRRTAELSAANVALESEITERLRIERELRTAKHQAEVANRAKSEFLAMMSHELRTPLNAVIGFSEILCKEPLGPIGNREYSGYAEDIRDSGTHLLSLINDILDLSKIEANRFELHEEAVDVAQALRNVLPLVSAKLTGAKLEFRNEFAEPLHQLHVDQRALKQMLINLLSNAAKFTPEGGRIIVKGEIDDMGRFLLRVCDNGIGIAAEHLDSVLAPFSQVDSRLARKFEGTGLGLPLTKRLMELHGGILSIDSTLGEGTTVSLLFPKDRVLPPSTSGDGEEATTPGAAPISRFGS